MRELGLLAKCSPRLGWYGSESEIHKHRSLAQGYQTCFFQEYPSFVYFLFFFFRGDTGAFESLWGKAEPSGTSTEGHS